MGSARTVFAASALVLAVGAHAQQEQQPSPYSLGLSVGRAPIGLNVSVVGRAQVVSSFSAFGKLGNASSTRPDTSSMGMSAAAMPVNEPVSALSWGGGVSWDFSPRLSATFEWISYDLRLANGPVRTTNLGLQYRY